MPRPTRWAAAIALFAFVLCASLPAFAASAARARVVPTSVESAPGQWVVASQSPDERTRKLAAQIDETVAEGVEDLGLHPQPTSGAAVPERMLSSLDPSAWVFAPRLSNEADGWHVRLIAVAPGSSVELVREETFAGAALSKLDVKTLVMLRDLHDAGARTGPRLPP